VKKEEPKPKKEKAEGDEEEGSDGEKKEKKPKNPLDLLPQSSFSLEDFKREFLNSKDKKAALAKFWEQVDLNGFSFWKMEYQKLPSEGKELFKTKNGSGIFLQKLDPFRRYCFAVHGVYGGEGNYETRGVWMWRGTAIPQEIREHDNFEYTTITKLDVAKPEDKALVESYWLNLEPETSVDGMKVAYVAYHN